MTDFHLDIAARDCEKIPEQETCDHCEDEEVSPLSSCVACIPNDASFHEQFLHLVGDNSHFTDQHDSHFRNISRLLLGWIIEQDQTASSRRLMSLLEIYVLVRSLFGGPLAGGEFSNRYLVPTFAADFRYFKQVLTYLFGQVASIGYSTSGHLSSVGIHVPQVCVQMGLQHSSSEAALACLLQFVGGRPIVNSQGFSKPFHV